MILLGITKVIDIEVILVKILRYVKIFFKQLARINTQADKQQKITRKNGTKIS